MKLFAFLLFSISLLSATSAFAQGLVGIDPLNYTAEQKAIYNQMTDEERENLLQANRVSSPDISSATSTNTPTQGNVSRTAVVADVGLVDIDLRVEEDRLIGNFSIISRMGRQNDIVYGLTLSDASGKFLGGFNLGEVSYLEEGQISKQTIDFKVPPLLERGGLVKLKLVAETKSGLPLSSKNVGEISLPDKVKVENICTSDLDQAGKITCEFGADFNGELVFKSSLISSVDLARVPVVSKGGASVELTVPDSISGGYFGVLLNQNEEVVSVFRAKSDKVYAKFRNVIVYENNGFMVVTAPVALTLGKKVTIEYNLTGVSGEVCLQGKEELRSSVFNYILEKKVGCESGSITLGLIDQNNNSLDKYSNTYSVTKYSNPGEVAEVASGLSDENTANSSKSALVTVILVGILILVIAMIWYQRKGKEEDSISNI